MSLTLEVVAAPGMTIAEVVRRSSARLSVPLVTEGVRVAQALQVHRFVVPHAERPVSFAPGLLGLLQMRDGVVESVRIGPHTEYLQGAGCMVVLDACAAALDGAGWQRDRYSGEEAYTRASQVTTALAGEWCTEQVHARLTLRRLHTPNSAAGRLFGLTQDVFLASLQLGVRTP
jgi:hypothetical protein